MRDKYNIVFKWNDGTTDSLNFTNVEDLKNTIDSVNSNKEQKLLEINKIKANGEYVTFKTLSIVNNLLTMDKW